MKTRSRSKTWRNNKKGSASSSSGASTISTTAIECIVEKLRRKRNRTSTQANYYSIWKLFNEFFIKLDRKPDTWEDRLVLFVAYLADQEKKSSTIKSYISAVKAVLRDDGVILNEDRYLLASITKGCRYVNDDVRTRLPIQKNLVKLLYNTMSTVFDSEQPYLVLLYRTILVTAYFGLFRVGELTSGPHAVKAKDVHVGRNKNKLMFVLHTSKTHWKDADPQIIKINSVDYDPSGHKHIPGTDTIQDDSLCPFVILKKILGNQEEQKK